MLKTTSVHYLWIPYAIISPNNVNDLKITQSYALDRSQHNTDTVCAIKDSIYTISQ